MESLLCFLRFVFIWGLTFSNIFGVLSSGMTSGAIEDASDITWAHAVNSREDLDKALSSSVDFLEADVSMGHVIGNERTPPTPVMAHPPNVTSDISLDIWLKTILSRGWGKGLKLDFKSIEAVEPSLLILEKYSSQLNSSLWLHADVLPGPVRSPLTPVEAGKFVALCTQYFPDAVLSLGWTTYWMRKFPVSTWQYEWKHVRKMADIIRCEYDNNYPLVTFSVRGIFASRSLRQLQWLLSVIPNSTLTVWSAQGDNVNVEDFSRIQKAFPKNKIFYDLPDDINKALHKMKNSDVSSKKKYTSENKFGKRWLTVTREREISCESFTYIEDNFIAFGRSSDNLALQRNLFLMDPTNNITLTGRLKFFADDNMLNPTHWEHKLKILFADVKKLPKKAIFYTKKNSTYTIRDPESLWSTVKSSVLYSFDHQYFHDSYACRMFHLNVNANITFQAWTIPCDTTYEYNSDDDVSKASISEISLEEELDDPEGLFLIGFYSYGEEYVLVYDLDISGQEKTIKPVLELPKQYTLVSSESTLTWNTALILLMLFSTVLFF